MGQAKQRGTREERIAEAKERLFTSPADSNLSDSVKSPMADAEFISALTIAEAQQYLQNSVLSLIAHRNQVASGRDNDEMEVRIGVNKGVAIIQVWWTNVPSPVQREFMWDGIGIAETDSASIDIIVNAMLTLGCTRSTSPISTRWPEQVPFIPMYEFHPQRFRALVPLAKTAAQYAQDGLDAFSIEAMRGIGNQYIFADKERIAISPLRLRLQAPPRSHEKVLETCMFYGDWVQHGRQIFDFPASLSEAFRRTDVDDIPLDAVKFPYESFYLHFGKQEDLQTAPGWHPDGAYVSVLGDINTKFVVQLCLTSIPSDPTMAMAWDAYPEPVYVQAIPGELMGTGIAEAADRVLAAKLAQLKREAGSKLTDLYEIPTEMKESGLIPQDMEFKDVMAKNATAEAARLPSIHATWKEMLRLIVNGIAYLSGYGDDITTDWPKKAPADLLDVKNSGTPKQIQRANSKLAALGYTPIHFCGQRFAEASANASDAIREGEKRPTWVRGSWVKQAYGPKHSLRRLQWRMPHMRNKDADGDAPGHLYLVS